jgi:glycosyltransferase involved in cell wall biosynthesis
MIIFHVVRRFDFDNWGGIEQAVWSLAKTQVKEGLTPIILATKALNSNEVEEKDGIKILRFNYFYPRLGITSKKYHAMDLRGGNPVSLGILRKIMKARPDVVHCHTQGRLADSVSFVSKLLKIKTICTIHGGYFDRPQSEVTKIVAPQKGSLGYGRVFDIFWKDSHLKKPVTVSFVNKQEFLISKGRLDRSVYIPNGFTFNECDIDNKILEKYDLLSREYDLCVARIDPQKNQKVLLEFAKLQVQKDPNYKIVLVGPVTNEEYYNELKLYINENNLKDNILIIKGISPEATDLPILYKSCKNFFLPSIHEPFGIVVLEAWAYSKPVFCSYVGGITEFADSSNSVEINPLDADDIFEKYNFYQSTPKTLIKMSDNARELIYKNYTWKMVNKRYEVVYKEVA